jgi:carboxyl-terminal processing protease
MPGTENQVQIRMVSPTVQMAFHRSAMKFMRQTTFLALSSVMLLTVGIAVGIVLGTGAPVDESARAAMDKMNEVYRTAASQYVDDVSTETLTRGAITGMLARLDPHSVYIDAERMERVSEAFNASFEGIGITYEFIDGPDGHDTLAVRTVIEGGPSAGAGLRSGDRIVAIDGTSAVGYTHEAVQSTLKGPGGTAVALTVRRPSSDGRMQLRVERGDVPLRTVIASFMANDRTAYIKINRFARTTYREFAQALAQLDERGMERLILDLRGNSGGLMEAAIQVADEFLSADQLIVSARSRHDEFTRSNYATGGGAFEDRPVIVLVDEQSASASEIVAGALQDHDRAFIIGERTYGKGLVQRQYQLDDGSALRLTISRFYTPAGRLIQTPYGEDRAAYYHAKAISHAQDSARSRAEIVASAPDSLRYRTDGGRTVVGGGGIVPDRMVRADTNGARRVLSHSGLANHFARYWLDQHGTALRAAWHERSGAFAEQYTIEDAQYAALQRFAAEQGYCGGEQRDNTNGSGVICRAMADRPAVAKALLKAHLAERLFGRSAWYPAYLEVDPVFTKALHTWPAAESLVARYPVGTP